MGAIEGRGGDDVGARSSNFSHSWEVGVASPVDVGSIGKVGSLLCHSKCDID